MKPFLRFVCAVIAAAAPLAAADDPFSGFVPRSLGPAMTGGRVVAFAVDPENSDRFYAGLASGGVWKTVNDGVTWTPVFEHEPVFSIGALAIDPKDPAVVWAGTGEGNSTRSVSWGDGVYKSVDGGKSWKNVGLKSSERIGRIAIDPRDSNVVYVAAEGSLWGPTSERGVYKTEDGGKSWNNVLFVSEHTGAADVALDPEHPDTVYASAYQRERRVWSFIGGGPESAIWKSTDAGKSWNKIMNGIPKRDLGRIGLSVSPADPRVVYASVEASEKKGGVFRSLDGGATWEKRNDLNPTPWYYSQITADPKEAGRVYVVGEGMFVSDDGGKTFRHLNEKAKHGDTHVVWIDPRRDDHLRAGCDGGIYESYDGGESWRFTANMSVTQFYRVAFDFRKPHYYVYGGTQDNNTVGGPSATDSASGIVNADWFVTVGGDGFFSQVDPKDPTTVYSEYQYGGLVRFDTRTGGKIGIVPQPAPGEEAYRWNWDAPIIVSPHDHRTIYFAANYLFRSRDRGDSWERLGPDLTRRIDRDTLPMMGRFWGRNAVAKNEGISFYGNITALAESPRREGLLYAGTDDGRIQVSGDGGAHWSAIDKFPGVPEMTYVSRVTPSAHADDLVYAAFDGHKNRDFAPHLLASSDRGRTWKSIAGDLPKDSPVSVVAEDPFDPGLLFAGTEFGAFFSLDAGVHWKKISGLPTIAVKDIAVHPETHDLLLATFGRGFYVVDDISPIEKMPAGTLAERAALVAAGNARLYLPSRPRGGQPKGDQGDDFYYADNPPYGAVFTYYVKDEIENSAEKRRKEAEKRLEAAAPVAGGKKKEAARETPAMSLEEAIRAANPKTSEALKESEKAAALLTVWDESGRAVRTIEGPVTAGFHRVVWDMRMPPPYRRPGESNEDFYPAPTGPLVLPGKFSARLALRVDGKIEAVGARRPFVVRTDADAALSAADREALHRALARLRPLQSAGWGALQTVDQAWADLGKVPAAIEDTPGPPDGLEERYRAVRDRLEAIRHALRGDPKLASLNPPPAIVDRIDQVVDDLRLASAAPTKTDLDQMAAAEKLLAEQIAAFETWRAKDLAELDRSLDEAGAPWTPGRMPRVGK